MTWTFSDCQKHWEGRRKSNNYRSIAKCGWHRSREYMEWNKYDQCFDLTLHSTVVVRVYPDKYVVNCGGWFSNITRKKIRDWADVHLAGQHHTKFIENKFVYYNGDMVSVFHNNMEFSTSGFPLHPVLPTGYKMRKGATQEFNEMAKKVRTRLMPRILLGEFEGVYDDDNMLTERQLLWGIKQFVARTEGMFVEQFTTEDLAGFFTLRPQQSFGRPRHQMFEPRQRTGLERLETNLNAARRAWLGEHSNRDLYEVVPKEFS